MTADTHYITPMDTPFGTLTLIATDRGLRAVRWPQEMANRVRLPDEVTSQPDHPILRASRLQLQEYLDCQRKSFDLPFDLRGTEFQESAWRALASIPYGETTTYGQQAARLGRPKAARAIGAANGKNAILIDRETGKVILYRAVLHGKAFASKRPFDLKTVIPGPPFSF